MYINNDLRIGSGASGGASGYKVAVDGKIIAEEVRVQLSSAWPDYVFEEDYKIMSLEKLEQEILQLGHLPGIPSAQEVESEGIALGNMQKMMMEKIEELTLHIIQLNKEIEQLKSSADEK